LVTTRGSLLVNLGDVALQSGDLGAAEDYGKRALEIAETSGYRALSGWIRLLLARVALRREDLAAARSELAAVAKVAIDTGRPTLRVATASCLADMLATQGDLSSARRILRLASEYPAIRPLDRDEVLAQLTKLGPETEAAPMPPAITLEEVLHRIVVEADVGFAPLLASINRPGVKPTSAQPA
jgi:hypothetical protein